MSTLRNELSAFAASLGVSSCVSEALLHAASLPTDGEIGLMKGFESAEAIQQRLVEGGLIDRTASLLWGGAQKLCTAAADSGAALNSKFAADGEAFKGERSISVQ